MERFSLDMKLLMLTTADVFTLRDAVIGIHGTGQTGGGKTSAMATVAKSYLAAEFGGAVWTVKKEDVGDWVSHAKDNGRLNSVVMIGDGGGRFNFIQYLLAKHGVAGLGVVCDCVMNIMESTRLGKANASKTSEPFFEDACRQVLGNTLLILYGATGTVCLSDIMPLVSSAPKSREQVHDAEWQEQSFFFAMLSKARRQPVVAIPSEELDKVGQYWAEEYADTPDKTRGNINISLSVALARFNSGRLNEVFCTTTNVVPEMMCLGVIIIANMPPATWQEDGVIGQRLLRLIFQRAILARNDLPEQFRERPIFWWSDENQVLVAPQDALFHSLCRASRVCSVVMTQSLPSYYASIGGESPQASADQLLGNFGNKLFFASADPVTNRWASDTIGRTLQYRSNASQSESTGTSWGMNSGESTGWNSGTNSGSSTNNQGTSYSSGSSSGKSGGSSWGRNAGVNNGHSTSSGVTEVLENEIEPGDFARHLLTGGPANGNRVTAVWFSSGKRFANGRNHTIARFKQS